MSSASNLIPVALMFSAILDGVTDLVITTKPRWRAKAMHTWNRWNSNKLENLHRRHTMSYRSKSLYLSNWSIVFPSNLFDDWITEHIWIISSPYRQRWITKRRVSLQRNTYNLIQERIWIVSSMGLYSFVARDELVSKSAQLKFHNQEILLINIDLWSRSIPWAFVAGNMDWIPPE